MFWSWSSNTLATWCGRLARWKDPEAGKDWGQEEKRAPEDETLDGTTDSVDLSLSKVWKMVKDREAWHAAVHRLATSWTRLGNWTTTTTKPYASSSWSKNHSPEHQPLPNATSVTTGWWNKKVKALVTQSHTTLCDPMGRRPPASSVHEILQTRTLEWVAISFSRGSSSGIKLGPPAPQADSLLSGPTGKRERWKIKTLMKKTHKGRKGMAMVPRDHDYKYTPVLQESP